MRLAFIAPRFSETATIGGAETLLKNLAVHAARAGHEVDFLTTCAENHFTWENTRPAGTKDVEGLRVHFFEVNEDRDIETFLAVQEDISDRRPVTIAEEEAWVANSVNSRTLEEHLRREGEHYDFILAGPYLFGVTYFAAQLHPEKTFLVPCLHDECFAYLEIMKRLFGAVRGFLFNSEPEMELARRLYDVPEAKCSVVGMGLDPFEANPHAIRTRLGWDAPYVMYAGRREPLKGTPLLLDYLDAFRSRTDIDVRLVLTGSGDIDPSPELAPFITDLGFVSETEKQQAMAGAAAFIHPSVNESFGIVLLEAWLARTPGLVHARSEVLRWQCASSNGGLWFRAYPEFEEELLLLLQNQELNRGLAEAGRNYVLETYAWPEVMQRLFNALGLDL